MVSYPPAAHPDAMPVLFAVLQLNHCHFLIKPSAAFLWHRETIWNIIPPSASKYQQSFNPALFKAQIKTIPCQGEETRGFTTKAGCMGCSFVCRGYDISPSTQHFHTNAKAWDLGMNQMLWMRAGGEKQASELDYSLGHQTCTLQQNFLSINAGIAD